MVDREDGTGAGFTGVMPVANEKGCDVVCSVDDNGDEVCNMVCSGGGNGGAIVNIDQCLTGRNKCSENAVCKDLPDDHTGHIDTERIRKFENCI